MGNHERRELILDSIRSSCDQPLRAGRGAGSSALGSPACSVREAGVFGSERLGADAPRALRAAAARDPLHCACVRLCGRRLHALLGAHWTACVCAFGVRSGRCWRGCAVLWMVSTAGKPSQVVLGQAPCSLGVWGDVGRPHRVATVSQPCSCPYGVREKVLSYAWSVVRVKLSGWYKYFRVVLIHPLGDSLRVGALRFARYGQVKKVRCAHSTPSPNPKSFRFYRKG